MLAATKKYVRNGVALNSKLYFVLTKCIKNSMKPFCHYQRYLAGIKCLFTSDGFAARFIFLSPPDWITVILYLHIILRFFFFFFSPPFPSFIFGCWVSEEKQKLISGTWRSKLSFILPEIIVILGSDSNPN